MISKIFYILLTLSILNACECIPAIDTPKEIKPENGAKITLYHMAYDRGMVSLSSKNITLVDQLPFGEHLGEYKEAFAGYTNLKIKETSSGNILYNGIYSLEQNQYYSIYLYSCNRPKVLEVRDSVYENASFVRIVNMYDGISHFQVNMEDSFENVRLKCGDLTELTEISSNTPISILDEKDIQIWNNDISYSPNTIFNVIIFQNPSNSNYQIRTFSTSF